MENCYDFMFYVIDVPSRLQAIPVTFSGGLQDDVAGVHSWTFMRRMGDSDATAYLAGALMFVVITTKTALPILQSTFLGLLAIMLPTTRWMCWPS